ncbi:MAG TPA: 2OG-Fe(II) oxygenase [Candidatus Paceibacterota bacterium]|nr:2OG-Fe(II) oxygenase [Candidatus Paceibacterota bacterium]
MKIDFLRVLPQRDERKRLIRKAALVTINFGKWVHLDGTRAKVRYRPFEINIRWPFSLQFQLHINEYDTGGFLSQHMDYILEQERQYRIQFVTQNAEQGGMLICEKFIVNWRRFKIFEPCKWKHEVTPVTEGRRRVWNFGVRFAFKYLSPSPI